MSDWPAVKESPHLKLYRIRIEFDIFCLAESEHAARSEAVAGDLIRDHARMYACDDFIESSERIDTIRDVPHGLRDARVYSDEFSLGFITVQEFIEERDKAS